MVGELALLTALVITGCDSNRYDIEIKPAARLFSENSRVGENDRIVKQIGSLLFQKKN